MNTRDRKGNILNVGDYIEDLLSNSNDIGKIRHLSIKGQFGTLGIEFKNNTGTFLYPDYVRKLTEEEIAFYKLKGLI